MRQTPNMEQLRKDLQVGEGAQLGGGMGFQWSGAVVRGWCAAVLHTPSRDTAFGRGGEYWGGTLMFLMVQHVACTHGGAYPDAATA